MFSLLKPGLKAFVNNRNWLVIALFIFVAGSFYSYFAVTFEAVPPPGVESQLAEVEELFRMILDNPPLITALFVFVNNFFSMLIILIFGALAGISPLLALFLNGFLLGTVAAAYKAEGIPVLTMIITGILPHGLFELPALFLCGALALKLGYHCVAAPLPEKTRLESFRLIWKEITPVLPLVTLLLLGAALIEILSPAALLKVFCKNLCWRRRCPCQGPESGGRIDQPTVRQGSLDISGGFGSPPGRSGDLGGGGGETSTRHIDR